MSAVVCGKRSSSIFADELLPPSPPSPHSSLHHPAAKRSRRGSPPHRGRREALLLHLIPLFPDMDPQVRLLARSKLRTFPTPMCFFRSYMTRCGFGPHDLVLTISVPSLVTFSMHSDFIVC
jgi:hypothetical protein